MDRVLAFDLWGDYAHFRKHYTTTSPLTFSIPPRTTVCGLLAAIIGRDKREYLRYFSDKDASIAVQLLNNVKKITLAENLIDTEAGKPMNQIKQRTQIRFEFLKDPKYRIFVYHKDVSIYRELKEMLEAHKTVYTPCLGLSELLANFEYVTEYNVEVVKKTESAVEILTALPKKNLIELIFQEGYEYLSETMPRNMLPDRTVTEYASVIFERKHESLKARVNQFIRLENDDVITFL